MRYQNNYWSNAVTLISWIIFLFGLMMIALAVLFNIKHSFASIGNFYNFLIGISFFICGMGLLRKKNWARLLTIWTALLYIPDRLFYEKEVITLVYKKEFVSFLDSDILSNMVFNEVLWGAFWSILLISIVYFFLFDKVRGQFNIEKREDT